MLHMRVYGQTWGGARACYQYTIESVPADIAAASRVAVDFQQLFDYHVTQESNTYEHVGRGISRRVDTFRTLRGWRAGMTNRRYDRAVNK